MRPLSDIARILGAVVVLLIELLVGLILLLLAVPTLLQWTALTPSLATAALLFVLFAIAGIVGAIWGLISLGNNRTPILLAGGATLFAGATMILGVTAKIIPCAGPS